jgi:LEA14-like dessication related protein
MHIRRILLLLSALVGLGLAGCNTKAELGEIGISLMDVKTGSGSGETVVTLRFVNENIVPFGISSSTHKLLLNGIPVGQAVNDVSFGLAPMSITTRDIILQVENFAALQQFLGSGRATASTYQLENEIIAMRGDTRHRLRSQTSGTLSPGTSQ